MKKIIIALLLLVTLLLCGCNRTKPDGGEGNGGSNSDDQGSNNQSTNTGNQQEDSSDDAADVFGESLDDMGVFDGFFEGKTSSLNVKCISGTPGCYKLQGNVLTFTAVSTESVYTISGKFNGSIVIDTGDAYKFELELSGFSLVSNDSSPITILSGDEVSIQAKKNTKNYIYDMRSAIAEDDTASHSGAIFSAVDMELAGKGELVVYSKNNNGVHSKKDLQVKNLSIIVACKDNALKGNDSIELEQAVATLVADAGDAVKTTNSDISTKGNQRGRVSMLGGLYNFYAASDGIDAAYNVSIENGTNLSIYTGTYSSHNSSATGIDVSAKGIKAANEIMINGGNVEIRSSDDAIRAYNDMPLENGADPLGRISINGGNVSLYTKGDGLYADGNVLINGGKTFVLCYSENTSAINAGQGYTYTTGSLAAIMHDGTATDKSVNTTDFDSIGKKVTLPLTKGDCLVCIIGTDKLTVKMPLSMSGSVVMLGSSSATANSPINSSHSLREGDFIWE